MDEVNHNTLGLKKVGRKISGSLGIKALVLVFMGLILMIPLAMIDGLLNERQYRKAEAVAEIGHSWGGQQTVCGPILSLPVVFKKEVVKKRLINGIESFERTMDEKKDTLYVLPNEVEMSGRLDPDVLKRGIFSAAVYRASVELGAAWTKPDVRAMGYEDVTVEWAKATVLFNVTEPQRLLSIRAVSFDDTELAGEPVRLPLSNREWIGFPADWSNQSGLEVNLGLEIKGSERFHFLVLGDESEVNLNSSWAHPSFEGTSIPLQRTVRDNGFEANWKFSAFGRGLPKHWLSTSDVFSDALVNRSSSGVALIDPVDNYRLAERSMKYGALFVALGFVVFFLFEAILGIRLHGMQYFLAGAAQVLFFLIVLALSEIVAFSWAYLIGAIASAGLVSLYAISMLGNRRRSVPVVSILASLYGVLFVILKEQDYALLAGSALLFLALATVMFLTRKLDWAGSRAT
ncbi:cell envelope integrity protein CreD [Puniceicoccaceae bacterium K14]|nr:cell envelope integrity protein CreD [Puniceicoccaceae bacterium K14]